MGWEDQLRQLDADVAAGRLSAQEYRHRREELPAEPGRNATASPPPADPFPPAFRWSDARPDTTQVVRTAQQQPAADVTQIVHTAPGTPAPAADATQVVRQPAADATQVVRQPARIEADRTQVVPQTSSLTTSRPASRQPTWPTTSPPTHLQPIWPPAVTQPGVLPPHWTSPPWLSGAPAPSSGWTPAGPDFLADSTSRKPVTLLVSGVVLVVLVVLLVGAVMIFA